MESRGVRLTGVYSCVFFNDYVKEKIRQKRVIINGMSGSSWRFKRFDRLNLISTEDKNFLAR